MSKPHYSHLASHGFSLLELMITVAILGIITTIAYPSYQEHVRATRRADATASLMMLASALERHYSSQFSYQGSFTGSLPASPLLDTPVISPANSSNPAYQLLITAASTASYSIIAQRTGLQSSDQCGDFTLNQAGIRGLINASDKTVDECW